MEELRKLEEVQRMLTFMQSHGVVSSSNSDTNRFLASLFLLLPCGNLDLNEKCRLICEHMSKISAPFLGEASLLFNQRHLLQREEKITGCKQSCVGNVLSPFTDREDNKLEQKNFEDMALISLDAMQRANSTLEDFMDSLNEKIINLPMHNVAVLEREYEEDNEIWTVRYMDVFKANPFGPLMTQLECLGVLTERIIQEFKSGEEYWALERKLCSALKNQKEISLDDEMRAIHLKSFDYRVLNLLL